MIWPACTACAPHGAVYFAALLHPHEQSRLWVWLACDTVTACSAAQPPVNTLEMRVEAAQHAAASDTDRCSHRHEGCGRGSGVSQLGVYSSGMARSVAQAFSPARAASGNQEHSMVRACDATIKPMPVSISPVDTACVWLPSPDSTLARPTIRMPTCSHTSVSGNCTPQGPGRSKHVSVQDTTCAI